MSAVTPVFGPWTQRLIGAKDTLLKACEPIAKSKPLLRQKGEVVTAVTITVDIKDWKAFLYALERAK